MTLDQVLHMVDEFGRTMRDAAKDPGTVTPSALNQQRERLHAAIRTLAGVVTPQEMQAEQDAQAAIKAAARVLAPVDGKLTDDPNDPRLTHGHDEKPAPQADAYLVLSVEERAKGFVRPYRDAYIHDACTNPAKPPNITITTMGRALSETYARDPKFYGATYCCHCRMHRPVSEFHWYEMDGTIGPVVGT
jgi:hypothetical protein